VLFRSPGKTQKSKKLSKKNATDTASKNEKEQGTGAAVLPGGDVTAGGSSGSMEAAL
jgi:hypothetical protein